MLSSFSFDLIARGGPVMFALLTCSVIALAVIIERVLFLRDAKILQIENLKRIEDAIKSRDITTALKWSKAKKSPMLRIAEVALINSDKTKNELRLAVEEAGRMEVPILERYMTLLHTIVVISPLLGLLGTVLGMVTVFDKIVEQGAKDPTILAGGISQALITTAAGLSIAIPALIFYNLISKKIENLISRMEHYSITLHEILIGSYDALD